MPVAIRAKVICPYFALDEGEIALKKGASVTILKQSDGGFWLGRCGEKEGYFPFTCVEISETPTPRDERPPTPPKLKPAALTSSKRKVKPADVIGARRCSWDGFDSRESNPGSAGGPESKSKNPSQPSILKSSKSPEYPKKAFPAYDRTVSETGEVRMLQRKLERLESQLDEARTRATVAEQRSSKLEQQLGQAAGEMMSEKERAERLAAAMMVLKTEVEKAVSSRNEAQQAHRVSCHEVGNLKLALQTERNAHAQIQLVMDRQDSKKLPDGMHDDGKTRPGGKLIFSPDRFICETYCPEDYDRTAVDDPSWMRGEGARERFLEDAERLDFLYEDEGGLDGVIRILLAGWSSRLTDQEGDGRLSDLDCVVVFGILCAEVGLSSPWAASARWHHAAALMSRTMRQVCGAGARRTRCVWEFVTALQLAPWRGHIPECIALLLEQVPTLRPDLAKPNFEQTLLRTEQIEFGDNEMQAFTQLPGEDYSDSDDDLNISECSLHEKLGETQPAQEGPVIANTGILAVGKAVSSVSAGGAQSRLCVGCHEHPAAMGEGAIEDIQVRARAGSGESLLAALEQQLLRAERRVVQAQESQVEAEMMLVRAASDLEIEAEMMSPRDAERAVDASGSPEGVLQSPRSRSRSQKAGKILTKARLVVSEVVCAGDDPVALVTPRTLETLVSRIWKVTGCAQPEPDAAVVAEQIIESLGWAGLPLDEPVDDLQIDSVLHHILSYILTDE